MKQSTLFFSVVICTYNGENRIKDAITSILSQNFPHKKYEVIVVDDGSTDNTGRIVERYPVNFIKHSKNLKLSSARNSGMKYAKGKVYVCFDDDCIADKNWLWQLYTLYQTKKNIAGVGGNIIPIDKPSFFDQYLNASNYGNPIPSSKYSYNLINRLFAYLKVTIIGLENKGTIYQTNELSGGNSSFPLWILKSVGGWNPALSGVEDSELCRRIRKHYPNKRFYVSQKALLVHNHKLNLLQFLKVHLNRSVTMYRYYQEYKTIPPIFPFPIVYFLLSFLFIYSYPKIFLLIIISSPLFLYFSWIIKSIKYKKIVYLFYPYIQLIYETTLLIGILKGIFSK